MNAMPHGSRLLGIFFAVALATASASVWSAETPSAPSSEPIVELPPMLVTETSKARPWLYVATGDTEYLSRCTPAVTRAFVAAHIEGRQLVQALIPAEFYSNAGGPVVSVVLPTELKAADDAVTSEMIRLDQERIAQQRDATRDALRPETFRFQFLPNLRLDDRDMSAVLSYVNEGDFDPDRVVAAPDLVYYQLARHTPMLPQWLIEGFTQVYEAARLRQDPVTVPFTWISRDESAAFLRDPDSRRVLLPASELFAPDAILSDANKHPVRVAVWRAQAALFVHWAIDPANAPARDALWKFVARCCQEPANEAMFAECFGFGYADLRDRLSDYLPTAVKEPLRLVTIKLGARPRVEVRPATPAQIARIQGEWERLEVPFVRRKHPQFTERYLERARFTLRRAAGRGEADSNTFAALGLCELEAGDVASARPWLEQAAAHGATRPRVLFELARLRWEELTRDTPPARRFTVAELEPVLTPLRRAIALPPPLPEVYLLFADVGLRCDGELPPPDFAALVESTRSFRRISALGYSVAVLQFKQGRIREAMTLLAENREFLGGPGARQKYQQLEAALAAKLAEK